MHGGENFETTIRRAFARLTREDLPRAAAARGWPVRTCEEFERLLLDHLRDGAGAAPGPEPCLFDLVLAVELGERMLAGNCCCATMQHRLSKERGARGRRIRSRAARRDRRQAAKGLGLRGQSRGRCIGANGLPTSLANSRT